MKVIGKTDEPHGYICEINHTELEKFLNLWYNRLSQLKVGQTIDLGTGHDFSRVAVNALESTKQFLADNKKTLDSISKYNLWDKQEEDNGKA